MPESASGRQLTGDDIITELLRNIDAGAFKIRHTTLVPCVFNVYLHADDYDALRPISEFVRGEAKAALTDHLGQLNRRSEGPAITRWLGVTAGQRHEFKILEADWTIEFHRDEEDRLRPGDIEIYSDLGTSGQAEFAEGAKTTFITRRPAEEAESAPTRSTATETRNSPTESRGPKQVLGMLRYRDDAGEKNFPITRDQVVIGRGGKAIWVDIKLEGPVDISREHCRLRRDDEGGWFIKDLSQYGTSVNGQPLPSSLERSPSGDKMDRNIELPLPERASISLAGVLTLDFEAIKPA